MRKNNPPASSRGMGIIEVLIALAILMLVVYGISRFLTGAKITSNVVSSSSACDQDLQSISAEFKEDEAALLFSSVGPDSNSYYPSSGFQTEDQNTQFKLGDYPVVAVRKASADDKSTDTEVPNGVYASDQVIDLNPSAHPVIYNNHFNIKNTMNRLIAIANVAPESCSAGLATDGADLALASAPLAAKYISGDEKIFIAIDLVENETSICSRTVPRILRPQSVNVYAKYKLTKRYKDVATQAEKFCQIEGRTQYHRDDSPPMVLLKQSFPVNYCDTQAAPTRCGPANKTISFDVRTVREATIGGTACSSCIARETNRNNCRSLTPETGFTGNILNCIAPGVCAETDPGSLLYCSFGEKNWLNSASKVWQPCHLANVFLANGAVSSATVSTVYSNTVSAGQNEGTRATINVNNLPTDQHIMFDVRAVDTGQIKMGQSYCSTGGHCEVTSGNGIVIDTTEFNLGDVMSPDGSVTESANPPKGGQLSVTQQRLFDGIYQCQAGQINIGVQLTGYVVPNSSWGNEVCGNIAFIRGTGTINSCGCDNNGFCNVTVTPTSYGQISVRLSISDTCGLVRSKTFDWCRERESDPSARMREITLGVLPPVPSFTLQSEDRECGLLLVCPSVIPGGQETITPGSCIPTNWTETQHSGCVEGAVKNNVCLSVIDVCGRLSTTQTSPLLRPGYGTYLATTVNPTPGPTLHHCNKTNTRTNGTGNECSGAYCRSDRLCHAMNSCSYYGLPCTNDSTAALSSRCMDMGQDCLDPDTHGICSTKYNCVAADVTEYNASCEENRSCDVGGRCVGEVTACSCSVSGGLCTRPSDCPSGEDCECKCTSNGSCEYAGVSTGESCCDIEGNSCNPKPGTCVLNGTRGTCSCPPNSQCGTIALPGGVKCPDINSCGFMPPRPSPSPRRFFPVPFPIQPVVM